MGLQSPIADLRRSEASGGLMPKAPSAGLKDLFRKWERRVSFLVGVGADVVPDLVDLGVADHAFPGRHLVLAVKD